VISQLRRDYASHSLTEADAAADAIEQFRRWFEEAVAAQVVDVNAMSLATASAAGEPAVRTVLLKEITDNGLVFFTHYSSDKGRDLGENPRAALLFYWPALERQVRVTGTVGCVSREESERYFSSRPYGARLSAWVSRQSQLVGSRAELEAEWAELEHQFPEDVPLPPFWGGFRVAPTAYEFWEHGADRLHDRLRYRPEGDGWTIERLSP